MRNPAPPQAVADLADGLHCWTDTCCGWSGRWYEDVDTGCIVVVCSCGATIRRSAPRERGDR